MPQVQATVSLNIDGSIIAVDQSSETIQKLVGILDEWRQKEVDATQDVLVFRAALRDLQREIYDTLLKEKTDAEKAQVVADAQAIVMPNPGNGATPMQAGNPVIDPGLTLVS